MSQHSAKLSIIYTKVMVTHLACEMNSEFHLIEFIKSTSYKSSQLWRIIPIRILSEKDI